MSCKRYEADLADAVAGAPMANALERHLPDCAGCRARLDEGRRLLAAVDRSLGDELSVEPSPSLLARVRERIARVEGTASEPAPLFGTSVAWRMAAALAVAAGIAGIVWMLRPAPQSLVLEGAPAGEAARPSTPPPRTAGVNPDVGGPQPSPAVRPVLVVRPARLAAATRTESELIVQPGQAEALARFVAGLRARVVENESLLVARNDAERSEPMPLEIAPLEIRSLAESEPEVEPESETDSNRRSEP